MKIEIVRLGNSKGIRLPKAIIDQCGFGDHVELEVRAGEVVLRKPVRKRREGWAEAFAAAGAHLETEPDDAYIGDFSNEFDHTEWTWPEVPDKK